jgi:hypothetical protein
MKQVLFFFIGSFLCLNLAIGQQNSVEIRHSFPAASIQTVEARTMGGGITVTGSAESQATVEVRVSGNNRLSESRIREILEEKYQIDVRVENGKLIAAARVRENINIGNQDGLSISFTINVPRNVNSDLQTMGGGVDISNLSGGTQNFQTMGGGLSVENVSGNITGRTMGGGISLGNSQGNINLQTNGGGVSAQNSGGTITLRTLGGGLTLNNLNGTIEANTNGGGVTANDIQGSLNTRTLGGGVTINRLSGNVDASTLGGAMSVEVLSANEFVRVSGTNGNVTLILPANQGYNLNIRSSNRITTSRLQNFNGDVNERNINGTVGNGGTAVEVQAQNVNLNFR